MEAKFVGLDINHNKTEFMRNIKNYTNNTIKVILKDVLYAEVLCFTYLGSLVTYNNIMIEIKDRTASGYCCLQAFANIMKAR
jgi:hypothetical protein